MSRESVVTSTRELVTSHVTSRDLGPHTIVTPGVMEPVTSVIQGEDPHLGHHDQVRSEKERLLTRALPDAMAAATNWLHSNQMYGKPPSRFIRDITRIIFDPNELAMNRVTTLDKHWVSVICQKASEAYPGHKDATNGAVRNIISTMCSEARVSLGYNKNRQAKKHSPQQNNLMISHDKNPHVYYSRKAPKSGEILKIEY